VCVDRIIRDDDITDKLHERPSRVERLTLL
jgi:hypothetical protein